MHLCRCLQCSGRPFLHAGTSAPCHTLMLACWDRQGASEYSTVGRIETQLIQLFVTLTLNYQFDCVRPAAAVVHALSFNKPAFQHPRLLWESPFPRTHAGSVGCRELRTSRVRFVQISYLLRNDARRMMHMFNLISPERNTSCAEPACPCLQVCSSLPTTRKLRDSDAARGAEGAHVPGGHRAAI